MRGRSFRWLMLGALAVALAAPAARADDAQAAQPLLSDLMLLTQFRQVKLWYAEKADNWRLAAYELDQLKSTIERMVTLYPEARSVSQRAQIRDKTDPVIADLQRAIAAKDNAGFETAFGRVTEACNACHEAADLGFIVVRPPTRSPFANQLFGPQNDK